MPKAIGPSINEDGYSHATGTKPVWRRWDTGEIVQDTTWFADTIPIPILEPERNGAAPRLRGAQSPIGSIARNHRESAVDWHLAAALILALGAAAVGWWQGDFSAAADALKSLAAGFCRC